METGGRAERGSELGLGEQADGCVAASRRGATPRVGLAGMSSREHPGGPYALPLVISTDDANQLGREYGQSATVIAGWETVVERYRKSLKLQVPDE